MHHKRRRAKNRRAGCLMCKPHKANGTGARKHPVAVRRKSQDDKVFATQDHRLIRIGHG